MTIATRCGLLIVRGEEETIFSVPLTGVRVSAQIVDLVAEVNIEQRYINQESQPIEAVYKFPLDEGAGVCEFTANVDGRVIKGVVKETEEAQKNYQEAINSGHSAFLIEEKLPDVFKAKVGNLSPGSGAIIRITYITELKVENDEVRFFLPTTIAPRYVPAADQSSVAIDLASINYTTQSDYQVEFRASIKMASIIQGVRSPTHTVTVTNDGMTGNVTLGTVATSMDRDLVLYIKVAEPNQPRLLREQSNGSSALMLSLVPSFKLAEQKTELIFIVDRSGSMEGPGIQQAKQALKLFLHSLPSDCYVNVVGFGSTYNLLFPSSRKYGDEVLQLAKAQAESMSANMGGTEIYAPLELILQQQAVDGYLRQIFILTDGEVSNADQVIALVRRNSGRARVFALGLGSSASHHLVEGIARAGNGTALFASLDERLEKKVMQQLQDALQPSLTEVKVEWDGNEEEKEKSPDVPVQTELTLMGYGKPLNKPVSEADSGKRMEPKMQQVPCNSQIPPIFDGRHFVVYLLLEEGAHVPKWAKVVATSPVGPLSLRVEVTSDPVNGRLIHRLAAKKLIQLLQDRPDDPDAKQQIIRLSCTYGLASRYASFIAVDPSEHKALNEMWMMMKSRDVPIQVAHGWGGPMMMRSFGAPALGMGYGGFPVPGTMRGGGSGAPMALGLCSASVAVADSISHKRSKRVASTSPLEYVQRFFMGKAKNSSPSSVDRSNVVHRSMNDEDEAVDCMYLGDDDSGQEVYDSSMGPSNPPAIPTDDDKLMQLVSIQSFDGAFKMDSTLSLLLKTTLDDIKEAGRKNHYSETVWATLIALSYLKFGIPQLKSSWMLVANKAEKWICTQQLADEAAAKDEAEKYVKIKLSL